MSDVEKRKRAIEMALSQIERQFGKGSIMKLGGDREVRQVQERFRHGAADDLHAG